MRTDGKQEMVRAWLALEDQMAQEEAARLAALTSAELHSEMRAEGLDPKQVPSAEQLLAGAAAKAADRQWRQAGATRQTSDVISVRRPRRRAMRSPWVAAAAAVLLVAGAVAVTQGAAIVAWLKGTEEPIAPGNERSSPPQPTPHQVAEKLRDEAERSLAAGRFAESQRKLDAAWALDPAGEQDPRVVDLRARLKEKTTLPKDMGPDKPDKP